ncbi:MAG: 50S ribosomal protein L17 [Patescibacteria group bacterium]
MQHHKKGRIFGLPKKKREALIRSLALSLVTKESIMTTEARAREVRPYIEKLITAGKKDSLASRRLVLSRLHSPLGVKKIFAEISPKYKSRAGGYTRITKVPARIKDGSKMAVIELV